MRHFLVTLLFLLGIVSPQLVNAQEETASPSPLLIVSPSPKQSYSLPYPGMLPDNPLYSLKMIRDNVILFLITDPYKKAQFNLLQADKRLQSGIFLLQKDSKKTELALLTIAKGENYFHEAVQMTTQLKGEGTDVGALVGDLEQSAQKHEEVVTNLKETLSVETEEIDRLLKQIDSHQRAILLLKKR